MTHIPKEILERLHFERPTTWNSIMLAVKSVDPPPDASCSECGRDEVDHRTYTLNQTPVKHWREKCVTCKRTRHPVTGEMTDRPATELNRELQTPEMARALIAKTTKNK